MNVTFKHKCKFFAMHNRTDIIYLKWCIPNLQKLNIMAYQVLHFCHYSLHSVPSTETKIFFAKTVIQQTSIDDPKC